MLVVVIGFTFIGEQNSLKTSDRIEAQHTLAGDFYMDLQENNGNDFTGILEQGRHDNNGHTSTQAKGAGSTGGSNYAMADGSARFIRFPQAVDPVSLWAISDADRTGYAIFY